VATAPKGGDARGPGGRSGRDLAPHGMDEALTGAMAVGMEYARHDLVMSFKDSSGFCAFITPLQYLAWLAQGAALG